YNITQAYTSFTVSTKRGAIPGSIANGLDERGRGCVYFIDPLFGFSRVGVAGVQTIHGLRNTFRRVNVFASVPARCVYYAAKAQIRGGLAVDGADTPNFKVVRQTTEQQVIGDGVLGSWALVTGLITNAYAVCTYSERITNDPGSTAALRARPFTG